jgi:MoaA/NifB/PqqE/SkfB family radical SAM enzyme
MHAPHVDVGLDSRRTAHSPATQTLDFLWLELTNRCNLRCVHCYTGPIRIAAIAMF